MTIQIQDVGGAKTDASAPQLAQIRTDLGVPSTAEVTSQIAAAVIGAGAGDVVGPVSAADNEMVLFNGITGKIVKRSTLTGFLQSASGVVSALTASALKAALTLVKGDVGLGNVDNTTDAAKPVSTAQQTALDLKVNSALIGAANGIVPLDGTTKIASVYLPSYVDDVLEFVNLAGFPGTGETGKIYVDLATNLQYRWSGTVYVTIVSSPGTTDAVVEGTTNLYHTVARVIGSALTGLSLVTGTAVTAADSVLVAAGKLQKQITDLVASVALKAATASPTLTGILTFGGVQVTPPTAMGANVVNIAVGDNSKTVAAATPLTWSVAPSVAGQVWGLSLNVTTACAVTFPSHKSASLQGAARTVVNFPVGKWFIVFKFDGTDTFMYGEPGSVNNFAATAAPAVTDDSSLGYTVGSLWIKPTATRLAFVLMDATPGAAVWSDLLSVGGGGGDLVAANNLSDVASAATARTNLGVATAAESKLESICIACSDETTAITAGTGKVSFRMPFALTGVTVKASLGVAQATGSIFTVDINEAGATILSTKLTLDNAEKTSVTAAAAAVVSDAALAADEEITIDVDQVGDGTAKGLKVYITGSR